MTCADERRAQASLLREWKLINVREILAVNLFRPWETQGLSFTNMRIKQRVKPLKFILRRGIPDKLRDKVGRPPHDPPPTRATRVRSRPHAVRRRTAGAASQVWCEVLFVKDLKGTGFRGPARQPSLAVADGASVLSFAGQKQQRRSATTRLAWSARSARPS